MKRIPCLQVPTVLGLTLVFLLPLGAVVTPDPDQAFNQNDLHDDINVQMLDEALNPLLTQTVVMLHNLAPVDVDNDGSNDFLTWTGTLISPEWVLTCAHALQGTNGQGAGVSAASLRCETSGGQIIEVADFKVHPSWQKQQYLLGNDIALVRLATPVANGATFPRLSAAPFIGPTGVLIAGFGEPGTGSTGSNGNPGTLAAGINVLDLVGGAPATDGSNRIHTPFPATPASVAFMDFDQWELREIICDDPVAGPTPTEVPVALSAYSSMGLENEATSPPVACDGPINPATGVFAASVCDFLPGAGDSGGPAFLWPTYPNFPQGGDLYLTGDPVVFGVASLNNQGYAASNNASYGGIAGYTLVQSHLAWIYGIAREVASLDSDLDGRTDEAEFLAGTDPYRAPLAPSTFVPRPLDVLIQNIRILGEQVFGANETDLEFSADLLNTDTGRYFGMSLQLNRELLPGSALLVDPQLNYAPLAELGSATAGPTDTLVVRLNNADLEAVRQLILNGELLEVAGYEEQVYTGPTRFIDQPTDDAFEATTGNGLGELVLVFNANTDLLQNLQAGDLLIADTATGGYRPQQPSPVDDFEGPFLSAQIPFEISSVNLVNDKVHVAGHKRDLLQILKSGTFLADDENFNGGGRDLLDPPLENTYTTAERDERDQLARLIAEDDPGNSGLAGLAGLSAIPWHFNELKINDQLQLSGQVLLRSSGLRVRISFRDFEIKRASLGIDAGIHASMLLETTGATDNTGEPLLDKQKDLARIPLPALPITIAGVPCTIGPVFVLAVGAEANAPSGITIPLESSITIGAEVGWSDGQTFAVPIQEFIAPRVSDPTVFEAIEATASAWVEARLEVNISVAGGLGQAGPAIGIRAEAGFEVAPFDNPWWTMDMGAELFGEFNLNLLGFNVAGVEVSQPVATFFHADAGGPLIPAPQPQGLRPSLQGFETVAGQGARWARVFPPTPSFGTIEDGFVAPLPPYGPTGEGWPLIVGGANVTRSMIARFTPDGDLVWMKDLGNHSLARFGAALPDGRFVIVGYRSTDVAVSLFDGNGNREWVVSLHPDKSLTVEALAVGEDPLGQPEIYVAGHIHHGLVTNSDPALMKLDAAGNVLWASYYASVGDDEGHGLILAADGNLLLCGHTEADVAPPAVGTPDSGNIFKDATDNGLIMKIDSSDGTVLWANAYASRWGMFIEDIVETPEGTLFAAGSAGRIVSQSRPVNLFIKLAADGTLLDHTTVGDAPDWEDELTNGGNTPYDIVAKLAWIEGGLWACGTTGLGDDRAAWLMSLTDELGVKFYSVFDGAEAEIGLDLVDAGDGVAILGSTRSAYPWGTGGQNAPMLLKFPWEGMMRFHEDTGFRSLYLQPQVFHTSADPEFQMLSRVENPFSPQTFSRSFSSVSMTPTPLTLTPGGSVGPPVDAVSADVIHLEKVERSLIEDFDDWTEYHQLSGADADREADTDGDGLKNVFEAFFGRNPHVAEPDSPVTISAGEINGQPVVVIEFDRSTFTQFLGVTFESSETLDGWLTATGLTEIVQPLSPTQERVQLVGAQDVPVKFFRLVSTLVAGVVNHPAASR